MGCFKQSIQILDAKVIKIYDQVVLQLLSKQSNDNESLVDGVSCNKNQHY